MGFRIMIPIPISRSGQSSAVVENGRGKTQEARICGGEQGSVARAVAQTAARGNTLVASYRAFTTVDIACSQIRSLPPTISMFTRRQQSSISRKWNMREFTTGQEKTAGATK